MSSLPQLHGCIPAIKVNSQLSYVKGWEGYVTDNAKISQLRKSQNTSQYATKKHLMHTHLLKIMLNI